MGEFEADRFGGFVCLDYYICSFRRHQVVPFRGDEVLDGKGAVRAGDGHGIAQRSGGRIEGVEVVGVARLPVQQAASVGPACTGTVGHGRVVEYLHVVVRAAGVAVAAPHAERLAVGVQVVRTPDGGACQRG